MSFILYTFQFANQNFKALAFCNLDLHKDILPKQEEYSFLMQAFNNSIGAIKNDSKVNSLNDEECQHLWNQIIELSIKIQSSSVGLF